MNPDRRIAEGLRKTIENARDELTGGLAGARSPPLCPSDIFGPIKKAATSQKQGSQKKWAIYIRLFVERC